MTIKKNVLAVLLAIVSIIVIVFSLNHAPLLIHGEYELQDLTKRQQEDFKYYNEVEFKPEENRMSFTSSDEVTIIKAGVKTEYKYIINTTNTDTLFYYVRDKENPQNNEENCIIIKATDNAITTYDNWTDYNDGTNGYVYNKISGGLSPAWIVRIIGIVLFLGAVAIFFFVKNITIPMPEIVAKSIRSGLIAAVAVVLIVVSFFDGPIALGGKWVPDYNKEEQELFVTYNALEEEYADDDFAQTYNIFGVVYERFGSTRSGYNYYLIGNDMYRVLLGDNDETKNFEYDGGSATVVQYKLDGDDLYIYDGNVDVIEELKPEPKEEGATKDGTKYRRAGLSFAWLLRIVAVVVLGIAALVFFFYKPKKYVAKAVEEAPASQQ